MCRLYQLVGLGWESVEKKLGFGREGIPQKRRTDLQHAFISYLSLPLHATL